MKRINVCVFPAQNESAVEINNALSNCEGIEVFGIAHSYGHNAYNFKNYFCNFPEISDSNFNTLFENFILEHDIDVIFPTSDCIVEYLSKNSEFFSAKIVNSDYKTALVCNDKKLTYRLFKEHDFCPNVYSLKYEYPCFIKPSKGEGARGTKLIMDEADMPNIIDEDMIILEYLPGDELTVDCLTDKDGKLRCVLPRTREKIFSGMSVYGRTIAPTVEINKIAYTINEKLKMRGLWYFQLKKDIKGKYKLLEISMRCAGTMCQSRARGYNLPLLSVYVTLGLDIQTIDIDIPVVIDRTLFARYSNDLIFSNVYIDYDGTIIVKDKVCLSVIRFLYQCKNEGKKIFLVTRHNEDHDNDIYDDLVKHGIAKELFDNIYCLKFTERKSTVISGADSIFIDNSFFERKEVYMEKKIRVFGVENLDSLQDWRL